MTVDLYSDCIFFDFLLVYLFRGVAVNRGGRTCFPAVFTHLLEVSQSKVRRFIVFVAMDLIQLLTSLTRGVVRVVLMSSLIWEVVGFPLEEQSLGLRIDNLRLCRTPRNAKEIGRTVWDSFPARAPRRSVHVAGAATAEAHPLGLGG